MERQGAVQESYQTVGSVIQSVFRSGTNTEEYIAQALRTALTVPDQMRPWYTAPLYPTDLFAVTAYLAKKGGLIGFFDPDPFKPEPRGNFQFGFNRPERDELDALSLQWRGSEPDSQKGQAKAPDVPDYSDVPPDGVEHLWQALLDHWNEDIHCGKYVNASDPTPDAPPAWWKITLQLLLVADLSVLRPLRREVTAKNKWVMDKQFYAIALEVRAELDEKPRKDNGDRPAPRGRATLAVRADSTIACVGPKVRISPVGTTLRNLTRNLALLPGRGEMRCRWDVTGADLGRQQTDGQEQTLNLLLVPMPFRLSSKDFKVDPGAGPPEPDVRHRDKPNWENFELVQSWLRDSAAEDQVVSEVKSLFRQAWKEAGPVNGVIFPEYALTYRAFDRVCSALLELNSDLLLESKLPKETRTLEFVVAGSSGNCENEAGNTVLTRVWSEGDRNKYMTNSRRKQQRWRLDRSQIEGYGLGTALSPKIANWWETTPVGQKELHFHKLRGDSLFCALICEELARSDICHDILRAVGPNLVFALLMDSAQIPVRWPAQYAAALADDPGCAVLSFTSFGLVERFNRTRKDGSCSVALWKDDTGKVRTIDMPKGDGARGILLSLWSDNVKDQTIFGKRSDVRAWRYAGHFGVSTTSVI